MLITALCKVRGINGVLSGQVCGDLGISRQVRIKHVLPSQIDLLNQTVPHHYFPGAELQTEVWKDQERLITISTSYPGRGYHGQCMGF